LKAEAIRSAAVSAAPMVPCIGWSRRGRSGPR
jgi:hypothetical protein